MTNDDPPRIKTFKRRRKLPITNNASSSLIQEETRHGHVFIKQEEQEPQSSRGESTEELLSLLMKTDGVLSVERSEDAMTVAKDNDQQQSPSQQEFLSLSENQENRQQQQQKIYKTSYNNNNYKNDSILFFLFIVTVVSLLYSVYTNQQQQISKWLSHFYTFIGNFTYEWMWIIKDKLEEMRWNIDIAVHSLIHCVGEHYYIVQQQIDQLCIHFTLRILDIRHAFAEWIDPYPRCTNHF